MQTATPTACKWTGMSYGSDRAHLTQLMDTMLGQRFTAQQWSQLSDALLFNGAWNVTVEWVAPRNETGSGTNAKVATIICVLERRRWK